MPISTQTRKTVEQQALRLAELLCGRLCHDLSGLLGTLAGTLELAAADPDTAVEALQLSSETAATLTRRLRLLRTLWGEDGDALDVAGLRRIAEDLPGAHRAKLDFTGLIADAAIPAAAARLLLNVLLLALEGLPRGGKIIVRGSVTGEMSVTLDGARAAWPGGLAANLAAAEVQWDTLAGPRALQAPLTVLIAKVAGLRLRLLPSSAGPGTLLLQAA